MSYAKYLGFYLKRFCIIIIFLQSLSNLAFALAPYSNRELDELEKEFIQLINQSSSVIRNPLVKQYVNHLTKSLGRFAPTTTPYFFVVKSNEINAFAGPGGYIGINTQLILATENENELAGVMAHELAHVRLHHLYRLIEHNRQMRVPMLASLLASIALGLVNPTLATGAVMASMTGFAQDTINFTRANEKEADRIGIDMLIKAGFDPRGMASFFKKMQQNTRYYYTANIPAILRTHPLDEERIAEAENRSEKLANKIYPDNLSYHLFKELIRVDITRNVKELLDFYAYQCPQYNTAKACKYGQVLTLLEVNQFAKAQLLLNTLLTQDPDNLFYQIAMGQTEIGMQYYDRVVQRFKALQANYPENYAVLLTYGQSLLAAGQGEQAVSILLKGTRLFKQDLPLCEALAQAQAAIKHKSYAYFTQSQCKLLQGRQREALRQLKIAQKLAKNDGYLQARITAMMDDIQFLLKK